MKYIVEVREPVPSNLDEIAGKVAASFHISEDKALALLRRAPGAVTRAVSEREADVVSGIFERAGLTVVKRPVEEVPSAPPSYELQGGGADADAAPGAASAGSDAADSYAADAYAADAYEADAYGSGAPGREPSDLSDAVPGADPVADADVPSDPGAGGSTADGPLPAPSEADVWDRPLDAGEERPVDAFSRREGLAEDAELAWGGTAAASDERRTDSEDATGDGDVGGMGLGGMARWRGCPRWRASHRRGPSGRFRRGGRGIRGRGRHRTRR